MLKQAIPNIFVTDFPAALAYYAGPLGFRPLFVYGDVPFYAHMARDEAILAIRHVTKPVIDHSAGEALLSAFIEVANVDALHEEFQAANAFIRQAPRDEPWAMRSLIVRDLDDNLICFASPLPGASWPAPEMSGAGANSPDILVRHNHGRPWPVRPLANRRPGPRRTALREGRAERGVDRHNQA